MENACKFVLMCGTNKCQNCGVSIEQTAHFCCFHRYVAFRLNNKKKVLKAAVAIRPDQKDSLNSYQYFPTDEYDEYEKYEGECLSFTSSEDDVTRQHDYIKIMY